MEKKIKIAIRGVGNISTHHIMSYQKNPDVELYAFCDINEATLKLKGEKYGITRLYTDLDKMLAELLRSTRFRYVRGITAMPPVPSRRLTRANTSFAKSRWL
jgi:hypothetical protein